MKGSSKRKKAEGNDEGLAMEPDKKTKLEKNDESIESSELENNEEDKLVEETKKIVRRRTTPRELYSPEPFSEVRSSN